jgi:hypothetical protein
MKCFEVRPNKVSMIPGPSWSRRHAFQASAPS